MGLRAESERPIPVSFDSSTSASPLGPTLGTPLGPRRTGTDLAYQEQTEWCWAACMQMTLLGLGLSSPRQCQLAGMAFGPPFPGADPGQGCCKSPSNSTCNQALPVERVGGEYSRWGIQPNKLDTPVSLETLIWEINNGRPVEVGLSWDGGGGHAILVVGWDENDEGSFVIVNDPQQGAGSVWYADLVAAYGYGSWVWTWINLGR
jgi:hypothetical protein